MMTRVPRCNFHVTDHPATQEMRFCLEGEETVLELCDDAADRFLADMYKWEKIGQEAGPHKSASSRPSRYIVPIPKRVSQEVIDHDNRSADGYVPALMAVHSSQVPPGSDDWFFTSHALERLQQRDVTGGEVLWAAVHPHRITEGSLPGTKKHKRGDVIAVVENGHKRIVTCYRLGRSE